jgi:hypothetical protein
LIIRLTKTDEDRFTAAAKKPAAQQTVVTTPRDASNAGSVRDCVGPWAWWD